MYKQLICFLTLIVLFNSCGEGNINNNIPYQKVSFIVIPLTDFNGALTGLGSIGVTESCYLHGGYSCGYENQGIIVCRTLHSDDFKAYANTCADDLTELEIVKNAILKVKCPKCNKIYDLEYNGFCGKWKLSQYLVRKSEIDKDGLLPHTLYISN